MSDEEAAARLLDDLDIDVPVGTLAEQLAWVDEVRRDVEGWGLEEFQMAPLRTGLAALRRLLEARG